MALGPKPRSYAQRTPKKMIRLALRSALSDRAAEGKVLVVDWGIDAPKTKEAVAALAALGVEGRCAGRAAGRGRRGRGRASATSSDVHICEARELNAYDVLVRRLGRLHRGHAARDEHAAAEAERATDEPDVEHDARRAPTRTRRREGPRDVILGRS